MSSMFPLSYTFWLKNRLSGIVQETLATCDSCAMAQPQGLTRDSGPFLSHLKCCTYFPYIPNFSLGNLLVKNSPDFLIRFHIADQQGILLPLGLHSSPERQAKAKTHPFGQFEELLCPFFNKKESGCSIWENRPGVCATYFCKSDRGTQGLHFWADVESYLNHFEWVLASEVLKRLGFSEDDFEMSKAVFTTEAGDSEREYFLKYAWREWFEEKEEFYKKCAQTALEVNTIQLQDLLGEEYLQLEKKIKSQV